MTTEKSINGTDITTTSSLTVICVRKVGGLRLDFRVLDLEFWSLTVVST